MREKEIVTVLFFFIVYSAAITDYCEDLICYVDYISTLTCKYNHEKGSFDSSYTLKALWFLEGEEELCDLSPSDETHGEYICSIDMEDFSVDHTCTIYITAPGNQSTKTCKPFKIGDKFKPTAPINLTASLSKDVTVSWTTEYDMIIDTFKHDELAFELGYKKESEIWPRQRTLQIHENEKSLILLRSLFQAGKIYVARVRARPKDTSIYRGQWSSWSSPVSWRTPVDENVWRHWMILMVLVPALIVTIIIIIFKRQTVSLWKNVWVLIPDPESFFKPLYDDHHGSFKSWLGYPTSPFHGSLIFPETFTQGVLKSESCLDLGNVERQKLLLTITSSTQDHQPGMKCDYGEDAQDKKESGSRSTTSGQEATLDESSNDGYPSVNLDSDSGMIELMHVYADSEVDLSVRLNLPQKEGPAPSNIHILDPIPSPSEESHLQDSLIQDEDDEENEFYVNSYNVLSPASGTSSDFGYPPISLDLDTIDSGFGDSECGSPVDFGSEYERSYVKQWLPESAESSVK